MAAFFQTQSDGKECCVNADDIRSIAPMGTDNTQISWRGTDQKAIIQTPYATVQEILLKLSNNS